MRQRSIASIARRRAADSDAPCWSRKAGPKRRNTSATSSGRSEILNRRGYAGAERRVGPAFLDQHGASLSDARRRAMMAIERCGDCGHQRIAYNSCRNRNCPKCQGLARAQWLADRQAELLNVPYFHVVFTVPEPIATIAFQNQAVVYDILFRAASETLRTIAADPKHLGAEIGFLAVLHTWGQNLLHHPHLHCLVPGGGIAPDAGRWIACRAGFFLPVRVLSRMFRGLFLHYLEKAFASVLLQILALIAHYPRDDRVASSQAATPNSSAMKAACALMSLPSIFRTCPFLIIAIASKPASVRRAVQKLPKPSPGPVRRLIRR